MGRPRKIITPEQRLTGLLAWAMRQGLVNVADELRQVLADLEQRQKRTSRG